MHHVRRRRVFYIAGFDPRGAGHYHRLYRTHAKKQSDIGSLRFDVSLRERISALVHGWRVRADDDDGAGIDTDVEFLVWDDIVRRHWNDSLTGVLSDFFFCLKAYLFTGLVGRYARACPRQMIAGLYPALYIIFSLLSAGWLAFALAGYLLLHMPVLVAVVLAMAVGYGFLKLLFWLGGRLAVFWLMRIYAFSARWSQGALPDVDARIHAFSDRILHALGENDADEVLIVAHSVGTMLAIPAVAAVLRRMPQDAKLSLMTLGQCIPLISFQPEAEKFRCDLDTVAQDARLSWADYTAPSDGICFPQLDPVLSCGLERTEGSGPHVLSPRFFRLYTKGNYRRLKFKWYTMHFLYLMSTDVAGEYDYFAMTAGPKTLRARLGGM
ncbi:MAG: hypothetical protein OXT65_03065 [Alphaproteobacteria bacterium]|nr:hypothetical protein [Alphaproteobacteria bacterium]